MSGNKKIQKLKLEELGRISVEEFKNSTKIPVIVVLDNVRSMQNVGSFFRTCDAFAIEKLVLVGICPKPPHRDITKSALGATESVDWEYVEEGSAFFQQKKAENYTILGVEQVTHSVLLQEYSIEKGKKYVLIFGNEVEGISDKYLPFVEDCVEIPQAGTKHSFNVSVSAGIVLWEFFKHFQ